MNNVAHEYLYNIPNDDIENYNKSVEYLVWNNRICNKFKFIRNLIIECTIKDFYDFYFVEPLNKIHNIPNECWFYQIKHTNPENPFENIIESFDLKILLPKNTKLDFNQIYCLECDLVMVNNHPIILCRYYHLPEK